MKYILASFILIAGCSTVDDQPTDDVWVLGDKVRIPQCEEARSKDPDMDC